MKSQNSNIDIELGDDHTTLVDVELDEEHTSLTDFEFGEDHTTLDPNIAVLLPEGCHVLSTSPHGESFWATIGRIDVALKDGEEQSFFIKILPGATGRAMVHSEFESMSAIYSIKPNFVPKPLGHGTLETIPNNHFLLCEFREMCGALPNAWDFSRNLAELHQNSTSPTGKFGFHVTTYAGNLPQATEWEESWQRFFSKSLRKALDLEMKAKGTNRELESLIPVLFDRVIPRLLGPLESHGRSVKPSLVHGDLWYANSGIDNDTGDPLVFDACCFYAHNEYEFGQWMPSCNRFGAEYLEAYHARVPISHPPEDYQGRLDLYKLRFNTHVSALFFNNPTLREQMMGDIRDLVDRYGPSETPLLRRAKSCSELQTISLADTKSDTVVKFISSNLNLRGYAKEGICALPMEVGASWLRNRTIQ